MKTITINDVARVAGVSVSTVSRILNNKPDVSVETRQRVMQVIDDLGYAPHAGAQGLAGGRTRSLAVLYPSEHEFTGTEFEFFLGASRAASKADYLFHLIVEVISEQRLLNLFRSNQVSGVVLMEILLNDWRVNVLQEHGYPFVMIGHCADNDGLSYVDFDFEAGVKLACEHLIGLGHRCIALLNLGGLTRPDEYGPAARNVLGYAQVCAHHGMTPIVRTVSPNIEAAYQVTEALIREYPDLTAMITLLTSPMVGVFRALQDHGRSVPDDFSVVGIMADDNAELLTPPVTAVGIPAYTMGYRAAQLLIKKLTTESYRERQILLPPELTIRGSTAPKK
ncbi:MAG: LacI family DNA-binding transcriptional regulator [Anaerolineae bacterium]|nr:LacI family DNA-binding transcriptional regulator [Anaerolineae bacterium]